MVERTSEGVRVCVRCGREGGLRDVRCAECGFDLTSDLQRDYDRYRSSTSGRGQVASEALDAAQQRKKTAPNAHGALGRFTPSPGGHVLDNELDDSRRERAGRTAPVGSSSDVAARTRGGSQRVVSATSSRPPAPPPPPSRLTGVHAPGARRAQEAEAKAAGPTGADLLSQLTKHDGPADDAGPRTTAWHPGAQTEDAPGAASASALVDDGPVDAAPVTRAWGEQDEERERLAAAEAARALEPVLVDPLAPAVGAATEESDPVAAALAAAAAEALALAVAPAGRAPAAAVETAAPAASEDATALLRVEDFVDVLAGFGKGGDDDDDAPGAFEEDADDAAAEPAAPASDATVMMSPMDEPVAEPAADAPVQAATLEDATVALGMGAVADDEAGFEGDDAPTVMAARPAALAHAAAFDDPVDDSDDPRTVVEPRAEDAASASDEDADAPDSRPGDERPRDNAPPSSRRKRRRKSRGDSKQAAAVEAAQSTPQPQPVAAPEPVAEPRPAAAPAPDADATVMVAAMPPEPEATALVAPAAAQPATRPAATPPPAAASPVTKSPARPASPPQSRPVAPSAAAMRAQAFAPSQFLSASGAKSGPISQNLRPGTTTYVDATKRGFRKAAPSERDQSGVYVVVGVVLGVLVLAAMIYFSR